MIITPCIKCGYDRRGLESNETPCPECGTPHDPLTLDRLYMRQAVALFGALILNGFLLCIAMFVLLWNSFSVILSTNSRFIMVLTIIGMIGSGIGLYASWKPRIFAEDEDPRRRPDGRLGLAFWLAAWTGPIVWVVGLVALVVVL